MIILFFFFYLLGTFTDNDQLLEFAKLGVYCQFDLFGIECSYYQLKTELDMPSDAQRMDKVVLLVKEGYLNRVLMSHDIHTKHRLVRENNSFQKEQNNQKEIFFRWHTVDTATRT